MTVSPAPRGLALVGSNGFKNSRLQISADRHVSCLLRLPGLELFASCYVHAYTCSNQVPSALHWLHLVSPLGHDQFSDEDLITLFVHSCARTWSLAQLKTSVHYAPVRFT